VEGVVNQLAEAGGWTIVDVDVCDDIDGDDDGDWACACAMLSGFPCGCIEVGAGARG
jgi:hypothetical protein